MARWQQVAQRQLLNDEVIREAATMMARAGSRSAAMQLLQRHVHALATELELDPDPETEQLLQALRQPPAAVALPAPEQPTIIPAPTPSSSLTQSLSFAPEPSPHLRATSRLSAAGRRRTMALLAAAGMVLVAVRISARQPTPPVPDAGAVTLYQRALVYLQNGRDGLPEARELLRAAVSRDSGYAPALARLAEVQARMNWYGYDRDAARMAEARALIDRSAALAPRLAERHLALAHWLLADRRAYAQAARQLDSALLLAGDNVDALMTRANIGRRLGRWSAAADDYARAARLDPGGYAIHLEQGNTLLLMRRYREARGALERARLLAPIAVDPVVWLAAVEVRERGDTAAARRRLEEGLSRDLPRTGCWRRCGWRRGAPGRRWRGGGRRCGTCRLPPTRTRPCSCWPCWRTPKRRPGSGTRRGCTWGSCWRSRRC